MTSRDTLDELVSLWQTERAAGRDIAAAELCRDCPELLPDLERQMDFLKRMEQLVTAGETDSFPPGEIPNSDVAGTEPTLPLAPPGFEILGELGRGGMGLVFRARQTGLNRIVALKMVLNGAHTSTEGLARFRAEAEAVARLAHPHIVQVHAWGEHAGQSYFVMEYLEGGTLEGRLGSTPQPPREAARLVMLLARAVHAAHQKGVIHRDLKPANILLGAQADEPALNTAYGLPKISDFGLVRLVDPTKPSNQPGKDLTATGAVLGTPAYMAPEQALGRTHEIGPATDVYALGAILYRMLAGRVVFEARSLLETLDLVRNASPRSLRALQPDVPAALETICRRCLAKAPSERYPTAQALSDDLGRFLNGELPTMAPQARRFPGKVAVGAALLVAGVLVLTMVLPSFLPPYPSAPSQNTSEPLPLTLSLRVTRFALHNGVSTPLGEIGSEGGPEGLRYNDQVRLILDFSEPTTFFLLALNANGEEQLLWPANVGRPDWPADPHTPPVARTSLEYPGPGNGFTLNDEERGGLQAIVTVASRTPLPSYEAWKAQRGALPWQRIPATRGVYRDDGDGLYLVQESRGQRGRVEPLKGLEPLEGTIQHLRSASGTEKLAVIAFPVAPK